MSKPFQWNFFNDESDRIEVSICNKMRKVSSGLFSNSCTKLLTLGAIHKACPHIRKGRAVRQKWTNTDRGRGWLAKCPLRKKIIATIFVKYLANYAACVSHLLRGQLHLLECYYRNCLIGTHMRVYPVSE